jgi:FkbM family methyltransferase
MRENLWLLLRNSSLLRKLSGIPLATRPMQAISHMLLPSDSKRRLRVRGGPAKGLVFELNPRWETQVWEGRYEVAVQHILVDNLKPGSVFYDVGAGFGFYSLLAAHLGARVFAFEPDAKNAEALGHHARLNSCDLRIDILNAAVLAVSGHAQLKEAPQQTGHGSGHIIKSPEAEERTRTVACVSLDEFTKVNIQPTLIKVDVEGSESEVFSGAEQLFERCHPNVICEVHDEPNATFVSDWFERRRYVVEYIGNRANYPVHLVANPK